MKFFSILIVKFFRLLINTNHFTIKLIILKKGFS
nr:MAG TPA: hypothetical protein [Caudoviricetes sp.]